MTIRFTALTMKGTLNTFSGSAGFLHWQIMFFHWQFCVVWKLTVLHLFGSLTVSVTVGWTVDSLECYVITRCVKGGDAWRDECLLVWKVSLGMMPGVTWEDLTACQLVCCVGVSWHERCLLAASGGPWWELLIASGGPWEQLLVASGGPWWELLIASGGPWEQLLVACGPW